MIQPKDLRIGNLFMYNGCEIAVEGIGYTTFKYCKSVEDGEQVVKGLIRELDPIPITEDVLPNIAGFKEDGDGVMLMFDTDKYTITMIYYDGWNLSYEEKDGFGCGECHLKGSWSLHEFQNLFHALTGEELTINLK